MAVVIDILERVGYNVEYAGALNAHKYDFVLVSITSDCDWWPFIAERVTWQKGAYKVVAGGAGVLNVRPMLPYVDYFVLGRAEGCIEAIIGGTGVTNSVVVSSEFNANNIYQINQTDKPYPHAVRLPNGRAYKEAAIGCNHKCLFCAYSWHRKHVGAEEFRHGDLWSKNKDTELALLDMHRGVSVNYNALRTTAIDGMSERLRFMVNKRITRVILREMLTKLATCEKPHQVKFYNILGYPTETEADWGEFLEDIILSDKELNKSCKQTCILLQSTPFRAMPATPMAYAAMSYKNYRGVIGRTLGAHLKGNIFYQGNAMWAFEGITESLPTVIQSAIMLRSTEADSDNIERIASSRKFWAASMYQKQATLEKYFDMHKLFAHQSQESLATGYLRTYIKVPRWEYKEGKGSLTQEV